MTVTTETRDVLDLAFALPEQSLVQQAGADLADSIVDAMHGQLEAVSKAMYAVINSDSKEQAVADIVEAFAVQMLKRRPNMAEGSLKARKAEVGNILKASDKVPRFYDVASELIDKGEVANIQNLADLAREALKEAGIIKGRAPRTPKAPKDAADTAEGAETPYDAETALVEGLQQALEAAKNLNRGDLVESIEHMLGRI